MNRWDWVLYLAATYIAIISLVRLMAWRRNKVLASVREQVAAHQLRMKKASQAKAAADEDAA